MKPVEREVYVTPDGLGRAAIVERPDGLLEIYVHWKWNAEARKAFNVADHATATWLDDPTSPAALYDGVDPEPSLYDSLDVARDAVKSLPHFAKAEVLLQN